MANDEDRPPLSEAQLEIMGIVWKRGEATSPEVWRDLEPRRAVSRNTVQTLMSRLVEKGWLLAAPRGRSVLYRPTAPRDRTLGAIVGRLVETAFGGRVEGLVMALLDGRGVSPEEAERIRALIDAAGEPSASADRLPDPEDGGA